ncbi:hypothetical protein ABT246_17460 [Streptomyces sp. NPDC001553]|uniref:hypothetical protein n=1 Tax=Streptomyces sp. NPDC001553 TaxID=3154385 RepID=UPI0033186B0B
MPLSRLLDGFETTVSPSYRIFGLVDTSVDTYSPNADRAKWLLSAPGRVYLQVPPEVIRVSVRLESWSTAPPANDTSWSGAEEVEVELPGGELALETIDGGWQEIPLILPSSGVYRMRWQWTLNRERGQFTSPLAGTREPLPMPPGLERKMDGTDQYCLIQIWRTAAGRETA